VLHWFGHVRYHVVAGSPWERQNSRVGIALLAAYRFLSYFLIQRGNINHGLDNSHMGI